MKYDSIIELIGNTPVVKIDPKVHKLKNIDLYAKLEMNNPFGSLKDKIGWGIIKDDINEIVSKKQTIIESSSGNTAKALAVLASIHGLNFTTVTNRIKLPEVKKILQIIGANIEELPGVSECPDFTDPNNPITYIEKTISKNPSKFYHTEQYTNKKNYLTHFETTGPEIEKDLGKIDYFIATLGTTGSSRGTAEFLKQSNPKIKNIGVISTKDDFIPGIRNVDETFEVGIYKKELYDSIEVVDSMSAIDSMLQLIRKSGILAGPTSGASYLGALNYLKTIDKSLKTRQTAVFIVCDRVEPYISYIEKRRPDIFGYKNDETSIRSYSLSEKEDLSKIEISVENAEKWIKEYNPIIVDLRGAIGFKSGHIKNSINIMDKHLIDLLDEGIPFSDEQPILFVCALGKTSKKFASFLHKKGWNAKSLKGGLLDWKNSEKTLVKSTRCFI